MAKKKASTAVANRSDVIRDILKARPKATAKEIRAELEKRGVKASDALINKIKYGRARKGSKTSRGAKNGERGSKANAIRGAFAQMGVGARARDVVAALAARGLAVTSAQVSTLRKSMPRRGANGSVGVGAVPYDHLVAAKHLAARLGGIELAQRALASLAQLIEE